MAKPKTSKSNQNAEIAGYTFERTSLLDEALTHPSLSGTYNYQRLEFLGDRVLGVVIATWLLEEYPGEAEGALNRRFTGLVRRETLAEISVKLGIEKRLKVTPGAEAEGTKSQKAIQADVCESVIGALYLDGGFSAADTFIRTHWKPLIGAAVRAHKDSKTQLQEWCQARVIALPRYVEVERTGPDHDPVFVIEAIVDGHDSAKAKGSAKRLAEQLAAESLFKKLTGES